MGRLIGSLLVIVLLAVALLGAVIVGLPMIPLARLLPEIENRASDFLGRDVRINGDLTLAALPSPRLKITEVTLANWQGGTAPFMASVDEVDLIVDLMPLFSREVHIQKLLIKGPQLALERSTDSANWQFDLNRNAPSAEDELLDVENTDQEGGFVLSDFSLNGIEIRNGSVSFQTEQGQTYALGKIRVAAQMQSLDQAMTAEVGGEWQSNQLGFSGRLETLADLLGGEVFTLDGQVRLNDHQANARGTFALEDSLRMSGVELSARGPSVADILNTFDVSVPIEPSVLSTYRVEGTFDFSDQRLDMQNLALTMGDVSLTGDVLASFRGGFFAQTRNPIRLRVDNVNQWIQALPNPPIASAPNVLTSLTVEGSAAISANRVEVFQAQVALNDAIVEGSLGVDFGSQVGGFNLETIGPVTAQVENLNQWLQILPTNAIPNSPLHFGRLAIDGDVTASPSNLRVENALLTLEDLAFRGGIEADYGTQPFSYRSLSPLRVQVSNANRWMDLIPNRPIPQSAELFGLLDFSGGLSGNANSITLDQGQLRLGNIQGAGSITAQFGAGGLKAQSRGPIQVAGPSVDLIAKTFGVNLPRVSPDAYGNFALSSEVLFDGQRLALNDVQAQVDATRLVGQGALDISSRPIAFDLNLRGGNIDTTPYIKLRGHKKQERAAIAIADPAAPWGQLPLNFGFLGVAQGRAVVQIDGLTTGLVDLGPTAAQIDWRNSALAANVSGTQLYGGQATGQVGISNTNGTSGLLADVNLSGVDAGLVLSDLLGVDQLQGVTSLSINVGTQGGVLQDWMSGLDGRFTANVDPFALLGLDFVASLNNLNRGVFEAVDGPNTRTQFRTMKLSGDIANGVADIGDLTADLGGVDVLGIGQIDLGLQRLDYKFELLYGGEVPIPLIVRGPWTKPAVRIDSQRVLQYALDNPQLFLDLLPAEWNLQGLLPEGFSLNNIEQQANDLIAQERARLEALARQEADRLAAQAQAEAQRLAEQAQAEAQRLAQEAAIRAQAEADRIAQQLADQAAAAARAEAERLANQLGGQLGQGVQDAVNQGIDQLGQSELGQQLQDQATQAAQDALGDFLGGFLGN